MMRHVLLAAVLIIGAAPPGRSPIAFAQATKASAPQETKGPGANAIAGRVFNQSGETIPNGTVYVSRRSRQPVRRATSLDEQGRYLVDDLPRGVYSISVQIPGYVLVRETREPTSHRPGDTANLVVRKGGAITGTVTGSSGEPVVAVRISAILVRDLEGRPLQRSGSEPSRYTDDRGVYRLFGLSPGFYLVVAGSKLPGYPMVTDFDEDVPTYYPSSTRDNATEVGVRSGDEASGIDIRYRGGPGNVVSGLITGGAATGSSVAGVSVSLMRAADDAIEGMTFTQSRDNEPSFAFYGVPDGQYYVSARRAAYQNDDGAGSRPVRVNLKARDVTGVELALLSFGSIEGRVLLEAAAEKDNTVNCKTKRSPSVEETLIIARRDQIEAPKERSLPTLASNVIAPGDKGEFLLQGIEAARYRIETTMLDEAFYVRTITLPGPGRSANLIDAAPSGVAVKPGERVNGLTILLAEGAASIRGRVLSRKDGVTLPDRLRVHLVPAEQQTADDTLRYAEVPVQTDGAFALTNVAPGRYWLMAREVSDAEANERSSRRLSWTLNSRAALRREAGASNILLDLKPCQRVVDYELPYAPLPAPPTPKRR
jgi:carboxypeptidase family protein